MGPRVHSIHRANPWKLIGFRGSAHVFDESPAMTPLPTFRASIRRNDCSPGPARATSSPRSSRRCRSRCSVTSTPICTRSCSSSSSFQRRVYNAEGGLVFPHQATGSLGHGVRAREPARAGRHRDRRRHAVLRQPHRADGRAHGREGGRGRAPTTGRSRPERARCSTRSTPTPDARLVAVVHAETSTGVRAPASRSSAASSSAASSDTLLFVDCVTSLGAHPLEFDAWGFDYAYSCTQKALAAPPGMSPVAISDRALERVAARKHAGAVHVRPRPAAQVLDRPADHVPPHRADPPHLRAARGAPRRPRRGPRERASSVTPTPARYLQDAGPQPRPRAARRPRLPARAAHRRARPRGRRRQGRPGAGCCKEHDVEIGGGLGPDAPPIWRLGLMGHNARRDAADQVLAALDAVLADTKQLASTA